MKNLLQKLGGILAGIAIAFSPMVANATTFNVPLGGTGVSSFSAHAVLLGNGISPIGSVSPGTAGNVLTSNGASADPTFQAPSTGVTSVKQTYGTAQTGALVIGTSTAVSSNGVTIGQVITNLSGTFTFTPTVSVASIPNAALANSTISGVALGSNLNSLTHDSTLSGTSYNGSASVSDWGLNLATANSWTGKQTFTNASSTLFSTSYASSTTDFIGTLTLPNITGTQCLHSISGVVSGTGADCGSGSGGAISTSTALSSGQVVFSTAVNTVGNDSNFFWDNTNKRLGIGTTTPFLRFEVASNARQIGITNPGAGLNLGHWYEYIDNAGAFDFGTSTDLGATSTPYALTITNTGTIGVNTSAPNSTFEISGANTGTLNQGLRISRTGGTIYTGIDAPGGSFNNAALNINGTRVLGFQSNGGAEVGSGYSTGVFAAPANGLIVQGLMGLGTTSPLAALDVAGANNGTAPLFQLSSVASFATTTRLIVTSGGNVGIGTTSPSKLLSIGGDAVIGASSAGGTLGNLYIPTLATPAGTFVAADATGKLIATTTPGGGGASPAGSGTELQYRLNGTTFGAVTNSAFLASAAKLGVGTTTPWASFETASGSPQIGITNPNAGVNQKHLYEWLDNTGTFNWGTTSDLLATSTPTMSLTNLGHLIVGVYSNLADGWKLQVLAGSTESSFGFGQATTTTYTITQTYGACGTYTWTKPAGFVSASTTVVGAGGGGAADDAVTTEDSGYGGGSSMALSGLVAASAGGGAGAALGHPASGGGGALVASTSILASQLSNTSYTVTVGCGGKGGNTLNAKTGIGYFNGGTGTTGSSGSGAGKGGSASAGGAGGTVGGGGGAGTTGNGGNGTSGAGGTAGTGGSVGAGSTVAGSDGGADNTAGGKSGYGLSQGGSSFQQQGTTAGDGIYGAGGGGAGNSNFAGTSRAGNGGDGIVIITSIVTVLPALNSGPSGMVQIGTYFEDAMLTINTYLGRAARSVLQTISGTQYRTEYVDQYGHYYTGGPAPTLSSCGTGPTVFGDDRTGTVTKGTGTTCTITFANAYSISTSTATACVATPATAANVSAVGTGTSWTFTFSAAQTGFSYICQAHGAYPLPI